MEEVCELVKEIGFTDAATVLAQNHVDGKTCSADISNGGAGSDAHAEGSVEGGDQKGHLASVTFGLCWNGWQTVGEKPFFIARFFTLNNDLRLHAQMI